MVNRAPYVFISYSRKDRAYVDRLAADLERQGIPFWRDERLAPSDLWWPTIENALRGSDAFLVVMTPESAESRWVHRECLLALEQDKVIFPLLLKPPRFGLFVDVQYEDVPRGQLPGEEFYVRLRETLGMGRSIAAPQQPSAPPEKPRSDQAQGKAASDERPRGHWRAIPRWLRVAVAAVALVIIGVLAWNAFDPIAKEKPIATATRAAATILPTREHTPEPTAVPTRPTPEPTATGTATRAPFEPELVLIPAGEFLMGSDPQKDSDAKSEEQPQHSLYLPDYYIGKYEITVTEYAAFVEATAYRAPDYWDGGQPPQGKLDHPVVEVSWEDARAYCTWLSEATGRNYRLPSEAEWGKAARGTDGRVYPWGDEPPTAELGNFENNVGDTTPVGQYSPAGDSPYGCVDMAGNVWEWTSSIYKAYPYDPEDGREDLEAGDGFLRVVRGGAFGDDEVVVRCAYRNRFDPDSRLNGIGFRVVVVPD